MMTPDLEDLFLLAQLQAEMAERVPEWEGRRAHLERREILRLVGLIHSAIQSDL
jgi:hypothetical protein